MHPDDYNFEVPETHDYYMDELVVEIKLFQGRQLVQADKNYFRSAEFWLSKGHLIQS